MNMVKRYKKYIFVVKKLLTEALQNELLDVNRSTSFKRFSFPTSPLISVIFDRHTAHICYLYNKVKGCLCVCLCICLCVCLCICLSVCLFEYLSVCLSEYLSMCLSVCVSVCLPVCLTAEPICFSFTMKLLIGPRMVYNYSRENTHRKNLPSKIFF